MVNRLTQNSLGIFWDGEEVDGITVYGYWKEPLEIYPSISIELGGSGIYERHSELRGDDWHIHVWDIKIEMWPSSVEWKARVQGMLRRVISVGAEVAWCGLEGFFVDPPNLFEPPCMHGGVWAALTKEDVFYIKSELTDALETLTDEELSQIHQLLI